MPEKTLGEMSEQELKDLGSRSPGDWMVKHDFPSELESLINRYSQENGSNTPDFILAQYILGCLETFNAAVKRREKWYGRRWRGEGSLGLGPGIPEDNLTGDPPQI